MPAGDGLDVSSTVIELSAVRASSGDIPLSPRPANSAETSNLKWFESLSTEKTAVELDMGNATACAPQPKGTIKNASDNTELAKSEYSNAKWWSRLSLPEPNSGHKHPAKPFTRNPKQKSSGKKGTDGVQSPQNKLQNPRQGRVEHTVRM